MRLVLVVMIALCAIAHADDAPPPAKHVITKQPHLLQAVADRGALPGIVRWHDDDAQ